MAALVVWLGYNVDICGEYRTVDSRCDLGTLTRATSSAYVVFG